MLCPPAGSEPHPCPGRAAVAYLARGQQVVLPGKGAELLRAGGARCSDQGEAQSAESCGLCLAPFLLLLPLAASLLHFKEHPREGVPREARSPVAALRARLPL